MDQAHTKNLITVKESIMRLLIGSSKKWYSSKAITKHLNAELGRSIKPTSYLLRLVKSGHIERAYKPPQLMMSKDGKREYIYRWSGRPYHDKIETVRQLPYNDLPPIDKAVIMRFLSTHYSGLPNPYQRMML